MKSFKVKDLNEGDKFTKSVYIDGENLLVPENIPLKAKDLERLKKWGVATVETEGRIIPANLSEKKSEKKFSLFNYEPDKKIFNIYVAAIETIAKVFDDIRNDKEVNVKDIDDVVNTLFPYIREEKKKLLSTIFHYERTENSVAESAVNCLIISVIIGFSLKLASYKMVHLAIAALLHDVGMLKIPEKIINKKEILSAEELKALKTHTLFTYKIITRVLKYPEEIGLIALQHHERWDGNGYPRGLKGEEIVIYARILSIADAFDAMGTSRPYRQSMVGYEAIKNILNDNSRRFDSNILKVFIKTIGVYPVGSIVLLSNSWIGRVVKTHSDAPLRPEITLIMDPDGGRVQGEKSINLKEEKNIFIARVLNPQELEKKSNE